MRTERGRSLQPRLPFREPVVTTSLRTGRSEVRVRSRKRVPTPEEEFERAKKANDWWAENAMGRFHSVLRNWAFHQSDISREVGESTEYYSNSMEYAQARGDFLESLVQARKLRIDPLEIVKRIKSYGTLLRRNNARESIVLERFYPEVINLLGEAFPRIPESKKEALLDFLRYQRTLPNF